MLISYLWASTLLLAFLCTIWSKNSLRDVALKFALGAATVVGLLLLLRQYGYLVRAH